MEEWRDVVGYDGRYMVSSLGRVKSLPTKYHPYVKILKPWLQTKQKYPCVGLGDGQGQSIKTRTVHSLVIEASHERQSRMCVTERRGIMKPEVMRFTKEAPCTKKSLWLCFRTRTGFRDVQVDEAHAVIGLNAPRYLERTGYMVRVRGGTDAYQLNAAGRAWLTRGIHAYAKNHPAEEIPYLTAPTRVRRIRAAAGL